MIDSVLKGTGNSRFLKSAVPAGTSWADALAMLQAGTFPIDFNGINAEGFQQVGTPLNKANLLKDATAAQIGLPPSTTPDGMFQALGNTGELHVWRKTVKNAEDVPAGYTLGKVQNVTKYPITDVRSGGYTIVTKAYSNLSVDDAGNVSVDESSYVNFYDDASAVRGKFIQVYSDRDILFIPNDANISTDYKTVGSAVIHNHYTDKYQTVTGYAKVPAGTTTTYPVSTNPNAYQEGSDAKPAGYTLGDVVSGLFRINRVYYSTTIQYADSVNVSDNGAVTLAGQSYYGLSAEEDSYNDAKKLAGKFIIADYDHNYCKIPKGVVLFIPANTTISFRQDVPGDEGYGIFFDRYQPVTGYAAIPAGTTIEYLGKLGDKARMQVVSYVGTGTYGESNPTNITADFKMKFLLIYDFGNSDSAPGTKSAPRAYAVEKLKTEYTNYWGYVFQGGSYAKRSADGKTVSFYGWSADSQGNNSGYRYFAIAIG